MDKEVVTIRKWCHGIYSTWGSIGGGGGGGGLRSTWGSIRGG